MAETKNPPNDVPCFEEALAKLEQVVHQLEEGEIGLAEALTRYEEGVKCLRHCYQLLDAAERRIELLSGVDSDGNVVAELFEEEVTVSLQEKARTRSRRRSKPAARPSADGQMEAETDMDGRGQLF